MVDVESEDENLQADEIAVASPSGAVRYDRKRRVVDIELDRIRKKSIISVPKDQSQMCAARAIVYGLARINQDKRAIESYRKKDRKAMGKKAEELHRLANVPIGPCGVQQIAAFEDYLDVQICIILATEFNRVS